LGRVWACFRPTEGLVFNTFKSTAMKHLSVGSRWNADLLATYHEQWMRDPASVDADWRAFFEGFELGVSLPPKAAKEIGRAHV